MKGKERSKERRFLYQDLRRGGTGKWCVCGFCDPGHSLPGRVSRLPSRTHWHEELDSNQHLHRAVYGVFTS